MTLSSSSDSSTSIERLARARARPAPKWARGLYAIVDLTPVHDDNAAVALAAACLRGGVSLVQLRAKGVTDQRSLVVARRILETCHAAGVPLLINDRIDLALAAGAHGVHLGLDDIPPHDARRLLGDDAIIGGSSHTLDEARAQLATASLDYLAYGPVYPSSTKSGHAEVTGLDALRAVAELCPLPLCVVGGIEREAQVRDVVHAGASLVAMIGALQRADDPETMARDFAQVIHSATPSPNPI